MLYTISPIDKGRRKSAKTEPTRKTEEMISNFISSRKHSFYIFTTVAFFTVVFKLFYDTNAPLRSAQLRPGRLVDALLTSSV